MMGALPCARRGGNVEESKGAIAAFQRRKELDVPSCSTHPRSVFVRRVLLMGGASPCARRGGNVEESGSDWERHALPRLTKER